MAISEEIIDRIRDASDIVEIVSIHVPLKKYGRNFKGLCPFHAEKTPSFVVSPEKQIYHCFGCGAGGNVFNFLEKIENMTFIEVVKKLADKANVAIPEKDFYYKDKTVQEREMLFDLYEQAMNIYYTSLVSGNESLEAKNYLQKRGIDRKIIDKFKIGYASKKGDFLLRELLSKGYSLDFLNKSGLISFSEKRKKSMDFFWNRLMFPVFDSQGKVVAFGGRVLDDKSLPKYINSPETIIYSKRKVLYGLNFAAASIRDSKQAIILEGYIDLITGYAYSIENVVATLGTALTSEHVNILKRYAEEVIIVYDSDAAGISAALRGVEQLIESGLRIKVVSLPSGLDPDDFLRKYGNKSFNQLVENALPFIDYQFKVFSEKSDLNKIEGKVYVANKLLPIIARIQNEIERREMLKKIAEKLSLAEESLLSELNKIKKGLKSRFKGKEVLFEEAMTDKEPLVEKELLKVLLSEPFYLAKIKDKVCVDDFKGTITSQLIRCLFKLHDDGKDVTVHLVMDYFKDEKINHFVGRMVLAGEELPDNKDNMVKKLLAEMERCRMEKRMKVLEKEINAMLNGKKEKDGIIFTEYNDLIKKLKGSHLQQMRISAK